MASLREILLASDFTARSDRPLDRALMLAGATGAKVVIAHVLEHTKVPTSPEKTREIEAKLRADLPTAAAQAELVIQTGSAPEVLTEIATARGSDLIVTGVARYNSVGDYLLGTAVDNIIRHSNVPVLVVRKRPKGAYTKVAVATDFSACSRQALVFAAEIFPTATIVLVHAYHVPYGGWLKSEDTQDDIRKEHQERLNEFLTHESISQTLRSRIEIVVDEGEFNGVTMRCVEKTGADLLVLGTRARGGYAHATMGSGAETLLSIAGVDVLIAREHPDDAA